MTIGSKIPHFKQHDKKSTSAQIISHIKNLETPMLDVRDLMLDIAKQYQQADKIGYALGLFDKSSSFIDSLSWCSIIGKMDHKKEALNKVNKEQLTELIDNLDNLTINFKENILDNIQHYRDKWMLRVLAWDFIGLSLFVGIIYYLVYTLGLSIDETSSYSFVLERPIFFTFSIISVVGFIYAMHFVIRNLVINNLLNNMNDTLPKGLSLSGSLKVNSRSIYSIFRPNPAGWNMLQKNRLKKITEHMEHLRDSLSIVLLQYPESK